MGRSLDCIVREARLAGDDIEWSAQAVLHARPVFNLVAMWWPQSRPAVAAITAGTGRNRV